MKEKGERRRKGREGERGEKEKGREGEGGEENNVRRSCFWFRTMEPR